MKFSSELKENLVFVVLISSLLLGCTGKSKLEFSSSFQFLVPTKDEVLRVNGLPLTVSDYVALRTQLKEMSPEASLQVGISALILEAEKRNQGQSLSKKSAFDIARYAQGELSQMNAAQSLKEYYSKSNRLPSPDEVRKELEALERKALVQRNPRPISQYF